MGAPPNVKMRGLQKDQEVQASRLYRDTRTLLQKIGDGFADSWGLSAAVILFLMLTAFLSTTFFVCVVAPLIFWIIGKVHSKDQTLPLLLPTEAGITDYRDAKPGRIGYYKARGEFFMGNQRASNRPYEMWLSFSHLLTHTLLVGTTGSGKTETLVSKAANYLAVGSGVCYADAKAAPKLGWQIFTLARYFGREDDYRALNYIKGNTSLKPDRAVRRSNNVNLFAYGSAESITQILVSLMPPGGAENKIFSERAISLISSIMPALVDLRDRANLKINPGVIRKSLEFEEIEKLKRAKPITPESREAIRAYLTSCSGYKENPTDRQGNPTDRQEAEVYRQHGFGAAYYTRTLASLSDTYADIYMVGRGDLSFKDCILRRRTAVIMIPSLEKSSEEMKNLAKVALAAQKNAISTGLPPDIEGRKEDVMDNLPTTAPVPYGIINDEFAFMMTPGYGAVLAQARGLFTAVTLSVQDYSGMKREDPDEAEQCAENTRLKIVMASEGLGETRRLIEEIAGEGTAAVASGYAMDDGGMTGTYLDNKSASFERRSRVDTMDTRSVVEGEGLVFWRDTITPWQSFYHGLDEKALIKDFKIHRLLDVDYPTRGPGAKFILKDTPIASAMKKAVNDGLDLGIDQSLEIPEFSAMSDDVLGEFKLDRALMEWRRVNSEIKQWSADSADLPANSLVRSEGLLIAALSNQLTGEQIYEDVSDGEDDEIIVTAQPIAQATQTQHDTLTLATDTANTVNTLAPPDDEIIDSSEAEFEQAANADDIQRATASLQNTSEALSILTSPRKTRKTPTELRAEKTELVQNALQGKAETPTGEAPEEAPTEQVTPKLSGSPAKGSSLLDAASWVMDPNLLADRVGRPVHQQEIDLALRGGDYAGRIEQALGTSLEESRKVSEETAVAITRSLTYPRNEDSIPATPRNEQERELVIQDSQKTISHMRMWLDED